MSSSSYGRKESDFDLISVPLSLSLSLSLPSFSPHQHFRKEREIIQEKRREKNQLDSKMWERKEKRRRTGIKYLRPAFAVTPPSPSKEIGARK